MNQNKLLWAILIVTLIGTIVTVKIGIGLQGVKDDAKGLEDKAKKILGLF